MTWHQLAKAAPRWRDFGWPGGGDPTEALAWLASMVPETRGRRPSGKPNAQAGA